MSNGTKLYSATFFLHLYRIAEQYGLKYIKLILNGKTLTPGKFHLGLVATTLPLINAYELSLCLVISALHAKALTKALSPIRKVYNKEQ